MGGNSFPETEWISCCVPRIGVSASIGLPANSSIGARMSNSIVRLVAGFLVFAALVPPQETLAQSVDAAAIEDLVLASRIQANEGVLDAYGHVSMRHPADPSRYLMARSLAPALITAADILEFDLDSKPVVPTQAR